ncbi:hypothetical protein PFISCL1PPCAC_17201, partial [Pristionchus fissidentatus]
GMKKMAIVKLFVTNDAASILRLALGRQNRRDGLANVGEAGRRQHQHRRHTRCCSSRARRPVHLHGFDAARGGR